MKLYIGENLKRLRREKNVTQEELAELLDVSAQSVSRWEKGVCYPDVELLPTLSEFFGVTMENLLGVDSRVEQEQVEIYLRDFQEAISRGRIEECIRIARDGVAAFPNSYKLLNRLMYALFAAGDEDSNIPDWQKNREEYDGEIVALGERILRYCQDEEVRMETIKILAYHNCEMGRKQVGRALLRQLPTVNQCRETVEWYSLEDQEKLPFVRTYLTRANGRLLHALQLLSTEHLLPDDQAVQVYEKSFAVSDILSDGTWRQYGPWSTAYQEMGYAQILARLSRKEDALAALRRAAEAARAFDERPAETRATCLLFGDTIVRREDFDTSDNRPMREILAARLRTEPDFGALRDTPEFMAVLKTLEA